MRLDVPSGGVVEIRARRLPSQGYSVINPLKVQTPRLQILPQSASTLFGALGRSLVARMCFVVRAQQIP